MKSKSNEWVSVSDLMSGVMAVIMLLLVVSVLQKSYSELKHKKALEQSLEARHRGVRNLLGELQQSMDSQGLNELVEFNISEARLTLKDNVFEKGSACLTDKAELALKGIENKVIEHLKSNSTSNVFVEGHTDNIPVSIPVTNYEKYCTVYDDNFTLSSARAREARKLLVKELDPIDANKVIVAGYGDSSPRKDLHPSDPLNRRIEIRFTISQ